MELFIAQQIATKDMFTSFLPLVLMLVIFYFLLILPTRRKQKKLDEWIRNLKNGDRVITTSGIYGTIAGIKDNTFHLKIADQVKIEIAKSAVAGAQMEEKQNP